MNKLNSPLIFFSCLLLGVFIAFCFAAVRFPAGGGISIYGPSGLVVEARLGEYRGSDKLCEPATGKSVRQSEEKTSQVPQFFISSSGLDL
jgi:hypothetical protein